MAASSSTTPNTDLTIPLISLTPLLSSSPSARLSTGRSILSAFRTHGFIYLTDPPIPSSTISSVFTHSAAFFARPQSDKDGLAWTTPDANRGYVGHGREKVSEGMSVEEVQRDRATGADLKESMEIGREGEAGRPNRWPADAAGADFERVMRHFFLQGADMHRLVMRAIALGLGYEETFFDPFVQRADNTLRLLHYPEVPKEVFERNKGQVRAGAHTDYGSVTLLWQDGRGGLQVETEDGEWNDVRPVEGAVVVNAGDLLSRWSNGKIRSTKHRVVEPPAKEGLVVEKGGSYPARYSVAYFCNPDFDKMIDALPGTWETEGKKWQPISSGEYLVQRLTATY